MITINICKWLCKPKKVYTRTYTSFYNFIKNRHQEHISLIRLLIYAHAYSKLIYLNNIISIMSFRLKKQQYDRINSICGFKKFYSLLSTKFCGAWSLMKFFWYLLIVIANITMRKFVCILEYVIVPAWTWFHQHYKYIANKVKIFIHQKVI